MTRFWEGVRFEVSGEILATYEEKVIIGFLAKMIDGSHLSVVATRMTEFWTV